MTSNETGKIHNNSLHWICIGYESVYMDFTSEMRINAVAVAIFHAVFSVFATVGNALVLWTFIKTPSLENPSNFLLGNLCLSDLFVGFVIQPLSVIKHALEASDIHICELKRASATSAFIGSTVSVLIVAVISVDRCFAVSSPYKYQRSVTSALYIKIMLPVWFCAIILNALMAAKFILSSTYLLINTVGFVLAFATVTLCYANIYRIVLHQKFRTKRIETVRESTASQRDNNFESRIDDEKSLATVNNSTVHNDSRKKVVFKKQSNRGFEDSQEANDAKPDDSNSKIVTRQEEHNLVSCLAQNGLENIDNTNPVLEMQISQEKEANRIENIETENIERFSRSSHSFHIPAKAKPEKREHVLVRTKEGELAYPRSNDYGNLTDCCKVSLTRIRRKTKTNSGRNRQKGEKSAANTVAIIILALAVCYFPFWVSLGFPGLLVGAPGYLYPLWTSCLIYINSSLNPIIYCFRNNVIRASITRKLRCLQRTDRTPEG